MVAVDKNICDCCGACVASCPTNAIEVRETNWSVDPDACNECGRCITVCPMKALQNGYEE